MNPIEITLGDHTIPVYAQRHAYLANRLGRFMDRIVQEGGDVSAERFVAFGQDVAYDLLAVLIPQLEKRIPRYEFCGYGSKEAMDSGDYDPDMDKSPTVPEMVEAFEVIAKVNRFNIFKHLEKILDPTLLKAGVNSVIAKEVQTLTTSPNSHSENGASASMSSMTTGPTSIENED